MSDELRIEMIPDPSSSTLKIKISIPEVFVAKHFFALKQFEDVFMGYQVPMSERLHALAEFVRITREN